MALPFYCSDQGHMQSDLPEPRHQAEEMPGSRFSEPLAGQR